MNIQERIELLSRLKDYLLHDEDELQIIKQEAYLKNPWFIPQFINLSIENICEEFLGEEKLQTWLQKYPSLPIACSPLTVGIVMAGNIPLVGFHDFLCVFMSGH